jgi:hypothetical protein
MFIGPISSKRPSKQCLVYWLKGNKNLYTIETKPIARTKLDSHTEQDVKDWFKSYHETLAEYKITKAKNVLNMDELGARVGCPAGEHVIVPIEVKELYTASPENRKSVTIIETIQADGREPPPPFFIITPGQKNTDNWIRDELVRKERVACSLTGYTNNKIALEYHDHLIKHTCAGLTKPWKILLLDGHESHYTNDFKLQAAENHIKLFYFPSHLHTYYNLSTSVSFGHGNTTIT